MRTGPGAAARASPGLEQGCRVSEGVSAGRAAHTLGYSIVLSKSPRPTTRAPGRVRANDLWDPIPPPHPGEIYSHSPTIPRWTRSEVGGRREGTKDMKERADC